MGERDSREEIMKAFRLFDDDETVRPLFCQPSSPLLGLRACSESIDRNAMLRVIRRALESERRFFGAQTGDRFLCLFACAVLSEGSGCIPLLASASSQTR